MAMTERDLVRAAERLRGFLQDPRKLWVTRRDPEHDILQAARVMEPAAFPYLGSDVVLAAALTESQVTANGRVCRWCHAYARVREGGPVPPVNQATLQQLGDPCGRCAKLNMRRVLAGFDDQADEPEPAAAAATSTPTVRELIVLARQRQRQREAARVPRQSRGRP